METTGTRSRRAPYVNQRHQIQVRSRWDHSHKVQERSGGNRIHQVQVRPRWQPVTTSRFGAAKDQIHQAQVKPNG